MWWCCCWKSYGADVSVGREAKRFLKKRKDPERMHEEIKAEKMLLFFFAALFLSPSSSSSSLFVSRVALLSLSLSSTSSRSSLFFSFFLLLLLFQTAFAFTASTKSRSLADYDEEISSQRLSFPSERSPFALPFDETRQEDDCLSSALLSSTEEKKTLSTKANLPKPTSKERTKGREEAEEEEGQKEKAEEESTRLKKKKNGSLEDLFGEETDRRVRETHQPSSGFKDGFHEGKDLGKRRKEISHTLSPSSFGSSWSPGGRWKSGGFGGSGRRVQFPVVSSSSAVSSVFDGGEGDLETRHEGEDPRQGREKEEEKNDAKGCHVSSEVKEATGAGSGEKGAEKKTFLDTSGSVLKDSSSFHSSSLEDLEETKVKRSEETEESGTSSRVSPEYEGPSRPSSSSSIPAFCRWHSPVQEEEEEDTSACDRVRDNTCFLDGWTGKKSREDGRERRGLRGERGKARDANPMETETEDSKEEDEEMWSGQQKRHEEFLSNSSSSSSPASSSPAPVIGGGDSVPSSASLHESGRERREVVTSGLRIVTGRNVHIGPEVGFVCSDALLYQEREILSARERRRKERWRRKRLEEEKRKRQKKKKIKKVKKWGSGGDRRRRRKGEEEEEGWRDVQTEDGKEKEDEATKSIFSKEKRKEKPSIQRERTRRRLNERKENAMPFFLPWLRRSREKKEGEWRGKRRQCHDTFASPSSLIDLFRRGLKRKNGAEEVGEEVYGKRGRDSTEGEENSRSGTSSQGGDVGGERGDDGRSTTRSSSSVGRRDVRKLGKKDRSEPFHEESEGDDDIHRELSEGSSDISGKRYSDSRRKWKSDHEGGEDEEEKESEIGDGHEEEEGEQQDFRFSSHVREDEEEEEEERRHRIFYGDRPSAKRANGRIEICSGGDIVLSRNSLLHCREILLFARGDIILQSDAEISANATSLFSPSSSFSSSSRSHHADVAERFFGGSGTEDRGRPKKKTKKREGGEGVGEKEKEEENVEGEKDAEEEEGWPEEEEREGPPPFLSGRKANGETEGEQGGRRRRGGSYGGLGGKLLDTKDGKCSQASVFSDFLHLSSSSYLRLPSKLPTYGSPFLPVHLGSAGNLLSASSVSSSEGNTSCASSPSPSSSSPIGAESPGHSEEVTHSSSSSSSEKHSVLKERKKSTLKSALSSGTPASWCPEGARGRDAPRGGGVVTLYAGKRLVLDGGRISASGEEGWSLYALKRNSRISSDDTVTAADGFESFSEDDIAEEEVEDRERKKRRKKRKSFSPRKREEDDALEGGTEHSEKEEKKKRGLTARETEEEEVEEDDEKKRPKGRRGRGEISELSWRRWLGVLLNARRRATNHTEKRKRLHAQEEEENRKGNSQEKNRRKRRRKRRSTWRAARQEEEEEDDESKTHLIDTFPLEATGGSGGSILVMAKSLQFSRPPLQAGGKIEARGGGCLAKELLGPRNEKVTRRMESILQRQRPEGEEDPDEEDSSRSRVTWGGGAESEEREEHRDRQDPRAVRVSPRRQRRFRMLLGTRRRRRHFERGGRGTDGEEQEKVQRTRRKEASLSRAEKRRRMKRKLEKEMWEKEDRTAEMKAMKRLEVFHQWQERQLWGDCPAGGGGRIALYIQQAHPLIPLVRATGGCSSVSQGRADLLPCICGGAGTIFSAFHRKLLIYNRLETSVIVTPPRRHAPVSAASSSPISASAPSTHTPSGGSAVQPAASSSSASHSKFSFATQQKVGPAETSRKHEKERDGEGLTGGARKKGLSEERQGKKRKGEKKVFEKSVEAFISPHHSSSGEAYIRKKRGRANRTVSSLIRSWFKGGNGRDLEDRQDDRKAEEGCHCEEDLPPEIASSQKRGGDASLPSSSASSSSFSSSFSASPVSSSSPSTANERGGEHQSHAKNKSEATAAHVLAPPKQERVEYVTALSELVSFQPTPVDEGKLLYAFSLNIEIESAVAFLYREEETERRRRRLSRKRSFNKLSVEQVQTHRPSVEEEEEEEEKKKRREEIKEDRQERKTDQQVMEESGLDQIAEEVRRSQGAQTRRKHIHSRDEGPEARVSRPEVVDKAIGGTLSQSEEVERDKRKGATSLWRGEENKEVDEEEEEGQGENSDVGLSQVGEDKRTGVEARGELGEERENQAVLGVESDGPEKEAKRRRDVLETRVSRSLSFARSPPRAPERVVIGSLLLHGGGSRGGASLYILRPTHLHAASGSVRLRQHSTITFFPGDNGNDFSSKTAPTTTTAAANTAFDTSSVNEERLCVEGQHSGQIGCPTREDEESKITDDLFSSFPGASPSKEGRDHEHLPPVSSLSAPSLETDSTAHSSPPVYPSLLSASGSIQIDAGASIVFHAFSAAHPNSVVLGVSVDQEASSPLRAPERDTRRLGQEGNAGFSASVDSQQRASSDLSGVSPPSSSARREYLTDTQTPPTGATVSNPVVPSGYLLAKEQIVLQGVVRTVPTTSASMAIDMFFSSSSSSSSNVLYASSSSSSIPSSSSDGVSPVVVIYGQDGLHIGGEKKKFHQFLAFSAGLVRIETETDTADSLLNSRCDLVAMKPRSDTPCDQLALYQTTRLAPGLEAIQQFSSRLKQKRFQSMFSSETSAAPENKSSGRQNDQEGGGGGARKEAAKIETKRAVGQESRRQEREKEEEENKKPFEVEKIRLDNSTAGDSSGTIRGRSGTMEVPEENRHASDSNSRQGDSRASTDEVGGPTSQRSVISDGSLVQTVSPPCWSRGSGAAKAPGRREEMPERKEEKKWRRISCVRDPRSQGGDAAYQSQRCCRLRWVKQEEALRAILLKIEKNRETEKRKGEHHARDLREREAADSLEKAPDSNQRGGGKKKKKEEENTHSVDKKLDETTPRRSSALSRTEYGGSGSSLMSRVDLPPLPDDSQRQGGRLNEAEQCHERAEEGELGRDDQGEKEHRSTEPARRKGLMAEATAGDRTESRNGGHATEDTKEKEVAGDKKEAGRRKAGERGEEEQEEDTGGRNDSPSEGFKQGERAALEQDASHTTFSSSPSSVARDYETPGELKDPLREAGHDRHSCSSSSGSTEEMGVSDDAVEKETQFLLRLSSKSSAALPLQRDSFPSDPCRPRGDVGLRLPRKEQRKREERRKKTDAKKSQSYRQSLKFWRLVSRMHSTGAPRFLPPSMIECLLLLSSSSPHDVGQNRQRETTRHKHADACHRSSSPSSSHSTFLPSPASASREEQQEADRRQRDFAVAASSSATSPPSSTASPRGLLAPFLPSLVLLSYSSSPASSASCPLGSLQVPSVSCASPWCTYTSSTCGPLACRLASESSSSSLLSGPSAAVTPHSSSSVNSESAGQPRKPILNAHLAMSSLLTAAWLSAQERRRNASPSPNRAKCRSMTTSSRKRSRTTRDPRRELATSSSSDEDSRDQGVHGGAVPSPVGDAETAYLVQMASLASAEVPGLRKVVIKLLLTTTDTCHESMMMVLAENDLKEEGDYEDIAVPANSVGYKGKGERESESYRRHVGARGSVEEGSRPQFQPLAEERCLRIQSRTFTIQPAPQAAEGKKGEEGESQEREDDHDGDTREEDSRYGEKSLCDLSVDLMKSPLLLRRSHLWRGGSCREGEPGNAKLTERVSAMPTRTSHIDPQTGGEEDEEEEEDVSASAPFSLSTGRAVDRGTSAEETPLLSSSCIPTRPKESSSPRVGTKPEIPSHRGGRSLIGRSRDDDDDADAEVELETEGRAHASYEDRGMLEDSVRTTDGKATHHARSQPPDESAHEACPEQKASSVSERRPLLYGDEEEEEEEEEEAYLASSWFGQPEHLPVLSLPFDIRIYGGEGIVIAEQGLGRGLQTPSFYEDTKPSSRDGEFVTTSNPPLSETGTGQRGSEQASNSSFGRAEEGSHAFFESDQPSATSAHSEAEERQQDIPSFSSSRMPFCGAGGGGHVGRGGNGVDAATGLRCRGTGGRSYDLTLNAFPVAMKRGRPQDPSLPVETATRSLRRQGQNRGSPRSLPGDVHKNDKLAQETSPTDASSPLSQGREENRMQTSASSSSYTANRVAFFSQAKEGGTDKNQIAEQGMMPLSSSPSSSNGHQVILESDLASAPQSYDLPTTSASGGGGYAQRAGRGGGLIWMEGFTVEIAGVVEADGGDAEAMEDVPVEDSIRRALLLEQEEQQQDQQQQQGEGQQRRREGHQHKFLPGGKHDAETRDTEGKRGLGRRCDVACAKRRKRKDRLSSKNQKIRVEKRTSAWRGGTPVDEWRTVGSLLVGKEPAHSRRRDHAPYRDMEATNSTLDQVSPHLPFGFSRSPFVDTALQSRRRYGVVARAPQSRREVTLEVKGRRDCQTTDRLEKKNDTPGVLHVLQPLSLPFAWASHEQEKGRLATTDKARSATTMLEGERPPCHLTSPRPIPRNQSRLDSIVDLHPRRFLSIEKEPAQVDRGEPSEGEFWNVRSGSPSDEMHQAPGAPYFSDTPALLLRTQASERRPATPGFGSFDHDQEGSACNDIEAFHSCQHGDSLVNAERKGRKSTQAEGEQQENQEGKKGSPAASYLATAVADPSQAGQGGGAGGSIVIRAFSLKGTGRLSARGGRGGRCTGGGGGGGVVGFVWIGEGDDSVRPGERKKKTTEGRRGVGQQGKKPSDVGHGRLLESRLDEGEGTQVTLVRRQLNFYRELPDARRDRKPSGQEEGESPRRVCKGSLETMGVVTLGRTERKLGVEEEKESQGDATQIEAEEEGDRQHLRRDEPCAERHHDEAKEGQQDTHEGPKSAEEKKELPQDATHCKSAGRESVTSSNGKNPHLSSREGRAARRSGKERRGGTNESTEESTAVPLKGRSETRPSLPRAMSEEESGRKKTVLGYGMDSENRGKRGETAFVSLPSSSTFFSSPSFTAPRYLPSFVSLHMEDSQEGEEEEKEVWKAGGWSPLRFAASFTGVIDVSGGRPDNSNVCQQLRLPLGERGYGGQIVPLPSRSRPNSCPPGLAGWQCLPCPIGFYNMAGESFCRPCTNKPGSSAVYTAERTIDSLPPLRGVPAECPYECIAGFPDGRVNPSCLAPFPFLLHCLAQCAVFFLIGVILIAVLVVGFGKLLQRVSWQTNPRALHMLGASPPDLLPQQGYLQGPGCPGGTSCAFSFPSPPPPPAHATNAVSGRSSSAPMYATASPTSDTDTANTEAAPSSPTEGGSRLLSCDTSSFTHAERAVTGGKAPKKSSRRGAVSGDFDYFPTSGGGPPGGFRRSRAVQERRSVRMSRTSLTMEDLPYHVQRIVLFGSNTPSDPWGLDAVPSPFLLPLVVAGRYAAFASQINSICAYTRWFACVHSVLKFVHLPLAEIVLRMAQRRRAQALLSFVLSLDTRTNSVEGSPSSPFVFWKSIRARELSFGIKLTVSASLEACYLDILDFDKNPLDYHVYPHIPMVILPADTEFLPSYTSRVERTHTCHYYPYSVASPSSSYTNNPSGACLSEPSSFARSLSGLGCGESSPELNRPLSFQEGFSGASPGACKHSSLSDRLLAQSEQPALSAQLQKRFWRTAGHLEENTAGASSPFIGVLEQVVGGRESGVLLEFFKRKALAITQADLLEAIHVDMAMSLLDGDRAGRGRAGGDGLYCHASGSRPSMAAGSNRNSASRQASPNEQPQTRRGFCANCGGLLLISPLVHASSNWKANLSGLSALRPPCLFRRRRLPPRSLRSQMSSLGRHNKPIPQQGPAFLRQRSMYGDSTDVAEDSTLCWRPSPGAAHVFGLCEGVRRLSNQLFLPHGLRAAVCIFPIDGFVNESAEAIQRLGVLRQSALPAEHFAYPDPARKCEEGSLAPRACVPPSLSKDRVSGPSVAGRWISDSLLEACRGACPGGRAKLFNDGARTADTVSAGFSTFSVHSNTARPEDLMEPSAVARPPPPPAAVPAAGCGADGKRLTDFGRPSPRLRLAPPLIYNRGDETRYSSLSTSSLSGTLPSPGPETLGSSRVSAVPSGVPCGLPRLLTPSPSRSPGASSSGSPGQPGFREGRSAPAWTLSRGFIELFSFSCRRTTSTDQAQSIPASSPNQRSLLGNPEFAWPSLERTPGSVFASDALGISTAAGRLPACERVSGECQTGSSLRRLAHSLGTRGEVRGVARVPAEAPVDPRTCVPPPFCSASSPSVPHEQVEVALQTTRFLPCNSASPSAFVCLARDVKLLRAPGRTVGHRGANLKVRHLRNYSLALVVTESLSLGSSFYGPGHILDEEEDEAFREGEFSSILRLPSLCAPPSGNALTSPLDPRRLHPFNSQTTPYVSPSFQGSASSSQVPGRPLLSPKPCLGSDTNKSPMNERVWRESWSSRLRDVSPTASNESTSNRVKLDEREAAQEHVPVTEGLRRVESEAGKAEETTGYRSHNGELTRETRRHTGSSCGSGLSLGSEGSRAHSPTLGERATGRRNKTCRSAWSSRTASFPQAGEAPAQSDTDQEFVSIPTPPAHPVSGRELPGGGPGSLFEFPILWDEDCSGLRGDWRTDPDSCRGHGMARGTASDADIAFHRQRSPAGIPASFSCSRTSTNLFNDPQSSRVGHDGPKGRIHTYERLPTRSPVGAGTAVAAAAIGELSRRLLHGLAGRDRPATPEKEGQTDLQLSQNLGENDKWRGYVWRVPGLYSKASQDRAESSGWAEYLGGAIGAARRRVGAELERDPAGCEEQSPDGSLAFMWASPSVLAPSSGEGGLCRCLRLVGEHIQDFFLRKRPAIADRSVAFGVALAFFLLHTLCVSLQYFAMYYAAAPSGSDVPFLPRNARLPPLLTPESPAVFPVPLGAPLQFPVRSSAETLTFPVSLHLYVALLCPPLADLFTLIMGFLFLISAYPDYGKLFVMSIPASLPRHIIGLSLRIWEQPQCPLAAWSIVECIAFVLLKACLGNAASIYLSHTEKRRRSGRGHGAGSGDVDPFVEEVEETNRFCICARPRLREEHLL